MDCSFPPFCSCQWYRTETPTCKKKVTLKLHKSFWGALPYLASSKPLPFPLQGIMWKQTTTACAISCLSSLFLSSSEYPHFPLFNRSMALPKSLTFAAELPADWTVSAPMASLSQTSNMLLVCIYFNGDIFIIGEIMGKVQWKKTIVYIHLRRSLLAWQLLSYPNSPRWAKSVGSYSVFFWSFSIQI